MTVRKNNTTCGTAPLYVARRGGAEMGKLHVRSRWYLVVVVTLLVCRKGAFRGVERPVFFCGVEKKKNETKKKKNETKKKLDTTTFFFCLSTPRRKKFSSVSTTLLCSGNSFVCTVNKE